MRALTSLSAALLALATGTAFAAGPARTPANHAIKSHTAQQQPAPIGQVFVQHTYVWDRDSSLNTRFDNNPDQRGRPNIVLDFNHQDEDRVSTLHFRTYAANTGNTADMDWKRRGGASGTTHARQNSKPDLEGNTSMDYRFEDNDVLATLLYRSRHSGWAQLVGSPDFLGAGGFIPPTGDTGLGAFTSGMTTFRFLDQEQNNGLARLRYSFANEGGENGTIRARLLYVDRIGQDGYNRVRFTYLARPNDYKPPVSPH